MKFRLLLWALGFLMQRASRKKATFKTAIAEKKVAFQIQTQDVRIARHYIINQGDVTSKSGVYPNPDFVITFINPDYGFKVLASGKPNLFMQGIQDQKIKIDGDLSLVMWFQSITRHLR